MKGTEEIYCSGNSSLLLYQEFRHRHSRSSPLDSIGSSSVSFALKIILILSSSLRGLYFSVSSNKNAVYLCICATVSEKILNKLRKNTEIYIVIPLPVCFIPHYDLNWFLFQPYRHRAPQNEADSRFRLDRLLQSGRSK
jgi:hypothetical protein